MPLDIISLFFSLYHSLFSLQKQKIILKCWLNVKNKDFEITTLKSTIIKQEEELTTDNPVNLENKIQESATFSAFDRPLSIETGEK